LKKLDLFFDFWFWCQQFELQHFDVRPIDYVLKKLDLFFDFWFWCQQFELQHFDVRPIGLQQKRSARLTFG
jgi:YHS domain-containing protein